MTNIKLDGRAQVAIIITLAAALIIWYFFSLKEKSEARKAEKDLIDDGKKQVPTGQTSTLTSGELQSMVNDIFAALDGLGTDEDKLYSTFNKLRNSADAFALDKAFGFKDKESLGAWIASDGETEEVNEILKKGGINYTFAIQTID